MTMPALPSTAANTLSTESRSPTIACAFNKALTVKMLRASVLGTIFLPSLPFSTAVTALSHPFAQNPVASSNTWMALLACLHERYAPIIIESVTASTFACAPESASSTLSAMSPGTSYFPTKLDVPPSKFLYRLMIPRHLFSSSLLSNFDFATVSTRLEDKAVDCTAGSPSVSIFSVGRSNRNVISCPGNLAVTAETTPSTVDTGHIFPPRDESTSSSRSPTFTAYRTSVGAFSVKPVTTTYPSLVSFSCIPIGFDSDSSNWLSTVSPMRWNSISMVEDDAFRDSIADLTPSTVLFGHI
mmetsp:Transcript_30542/g.73270  ORF Transcript_30542/g.73270 Transcript_30542/m.73270 type:complete len:299 (-) Transcript_30542:737-1633(-)